MTRKSKKIVKQIGVKLNEDDYADFQMIKARFMIENDTEIVRVLIRQTAHALDNDGGIFR